MKPAELAAKYAAERTKLSVIQADEKAQSAIVRDIEESLFDAMENQDLRSIRVEGLGLFSLNDLAWASITDREAALRWAEANRPEVITLNHTQLSVLVRDAIKGDGPMPDGCEFTTSRKISWRKS